MTTAQGSAKVVILTHRAPFPPGNNPVLLDCAQKSIEYKLKNVPFYMHSKFCKDALVMVTEICRQDKSKINMFLCLTETRNYLVCFT
jgi:hypothetical protein